METFELITLYDSPFKVFLNLVLKITKENGACFSFMGYTERRGFKEYPNT